MSIQRRLITLANSSRFALFLVIGSAILIGGLVILQAWYLSTILDQVHLLGAGLGQSMLLLKTLVVVIVLRALLIFVNEQSATMLSEKIRMDLREKLTAKVLDLGPAYVEQQQAGELSYAMTSAVDTLDAYFSQYLPQLVIAAILPLGILIIVFPMDTLSAIILMLTAPLIPIFMILVGKTTEALTHRQYQTFSRMSAFFLDSLRGLAELKNLSQSREHAARIDRVSEKYREATMRVLRISFLSALVLELAATLSVAVIAVEIGIRLLYGQMDFQQAFFLLIIAPEFYLPLRQLGVRFHASQNGVSAARRIFSILDQSEPRSVPIQLEIVRIPDLFQPPFNIRFDDISFAYPGREQEAISHISFTMNSGETTALVGLNGSGKSTLASLLLRFIQPQTGVIFYNGVNIQAIPIESWRAGIAYLDQQPVLFNSSIRQNLVIARQDANDQQITEALAAARLLENVKSLPDGVDTELGENAFRFSGGQAQRLGLARAFLKNAPLLVLDEPTSHLDALLEADLDRSLAQLYKGRTCLLIVHRKDSARQADRVIMLEKGRLVCFGKHSELISSNCLYASLFDGEGCK
jgi:ATP-binding cassette, subfamily C, bacterial CydD